LPSARHGSPHGNVQSFRAWRTSSDFSHRTSWWTGEGRADHPPGFRDRTDLKHARLTICRASVAVNHAKTSEPNAPAHACAANLQNSRRPPTCSAGQATDGKWFLGLFRETGRVKKMRRKSRLRDMRKISEHRFRLSANQNVILATPSRRKGCHTALFAIHGVKTENQARVLHAVRWPARRCRVWLGLANRNACARHD